MIIQHIRAQNVLKYAELSIDLAEQGLIAISGRNESGKSTIGETVCFALFGRTFSVAPEEIQKVVRWGEDHCSVTLDFAVEDRRYVLSRFLDRDGNHSAKLVSADDPENPIARGVQAVADALFEILGFEYEEYVESFYLAQREITTPHPHSQAVKIMAGVAPLETVKRGLQSEIAEREELLGEIQAEWDAVEEDIQGLGIQEGHLAKLEEQRQKEAGQLGGVKTLMQEITDGLETCINNTSLIDRAEGAKGRNSFLRFLIALLAIGALVLWLLLSQGAHLPQAEMARELLQRHVPQWGEDKVVWIAYLAAGLGTLFLLLWLRGARLKRRIATLREESRELGVVLGRAREIEFEPELVAGEVERASPEEGEEEADEETAIEHPPSRPAYAEYESLRRLLDQGEATVRMAHEYSEHELAWLGLCAERLAERVSGLDEGINDEQARLREAMDLNEVLNGLTDKRDEVKERIADRRRGLELLDGAIAQLTSNFNREVKELVGRLLPLFTGGHYDHLQIDNGLKVRVFSSEKRDFMDLDEISSGTQRQIMLALRLALSKKLLSRTVRGRQFALLDEPFAFFDEERTRRALQALADLGDNISQVWIVAQDFPEDCEVEFDTKIYCDRASDTLIVGA